jgi:hypothetical protein
MTCLNVRDSAVYRTESMPAFRRLPNAALSVKVIQQRQAILLESFNPQRHISTYGQARIDHGNYGAGRLVLTELLLEKGYEVFIVRRSSSFNTERTITSIRITRANTRLRMFYGDLNDSSR